MKSRTKYIGTAGTATLLLLIAWFVGSAHFLTELEGDSTCAGTYLEPCEWHYNITLVTVQTYYIQNKNAVNLVFLPEVKEVYHCKKDGRYSASWRADRELAPCGIGWKEFDWKTPLTSKYKYINKFYKNKKQEFKIVVFKHNPEDKIKFGGEITKSEFDPYFFGKFNITKLCKWRTETQDIFGDCIYYNNYTDCLNTSGINTSCSLKQTTRKFKCKTGTKQVKICDKVIGFKIGKKIINFSKCGIKCTREGKIIQCDMCPDENGVCDANCDGILQSGESGFKINITKANWHKLNKKIDSEAYRKLKECIV